MSSILKVNTIQDLDGNLIISKDSGGSGFLSPYASSSAAITYTVTVASKTSAHPYFGVGSSNGYFINGIESPIIEIKGNDTSKPYHYKFDQSDSSNSGHPLLFYNNVGKTTGFSTGVTTNGTPGQAGAYTMIAVDSQTPNILYYQCSSHANMGNHTFATSPVVNTGVFLTLPTADGSSGQFVTTNGSGVLSFANGSVPDDAITLAKMAPGTDGNIISYDASGNPVAVATGSAAQVLTSAGAGAPPTFATATVPDNAITLAKMASGTDGNIISYDTSGNPVAVATGSDGQVLTSAGAGAVPTFETLPASDTGLTSQQVFTSSGTWNKPSGITLIKVYVTGGGGGGGFSGATNYYSGGGGAGGGTAIEIIDVSSVSSATVTIGNGGTAGAHDTYVSSGGTSSFASYCSATGGGGGNYGGAIASQAIGGVGSNGQINLHGNAAKGGSDNDGSFKETSGTGGGSFWGGAGCGDHSADGHAGYNGGGGGGGQNFNQGSTGQSGGAGGAGIVVVEEYK